MVKTPKIMHPEHFARAVLKCTGMDIEFIPRDPDIMDEVRLREPRPGDCYALAVGITPILTLIDGTGKPPRVILFLQRGRPVLWDPEERFPQKKSTYANPWSVRLQ